MIRNSPIRSRGSIVGCLRAVSSLLAAAINGIGEVSRRAPARQDGVGAVIKDAPPLPGGLGYGYKSNAGMGAFYAFQKGDHFVFGLVTVNDNEIELFFLNQGKG